MNVKYLAVFVLLLLYACQAQESLNVKEVNIRNSFFNGTVRLEKLITKKGFRLTLKDSSNKTLDQTIFRYVPYKLDTGDIDHDGNTEILVGLIKPTAFDPVKKKRLFILRIDDGQIRPLWLGSRVCQELVSFKTIDNGQVMTIEKNNHGQYDVGLYHWQSFGLALKKYTHNELTFNEALKTFENDL